MAVRNTLLGGTDWIEATTQLNGAIDDSQTTITVDDTTGFPTSGFIIIGSELISHTGKTGTTFTGCVRGIVNTTASAHSDNTGVNATEVVTSNDLNDTFNGLYEFAISNGIWWMNSNMYDIWEDFSSYTVGNNIVDATKFSTSTTGSTAVRTFTAQSVSAGDPGGTSPYARMRHAGGQDGAETTYLLKIFGFTPDKHKHIKMRLILSHFTSVTAQNTIAVSFNKGSNYDTLFGTSMSGVSANMNISSHILIIAKGSDEYDCYYGSRFIRTITDASPELWFRTTNSTTNNSSNTMDINIDDIRENKFEVQ